MTEINLKIRKRIKKDLVSQLKQGSKVGSQWLDLVEDYLTLWDIKEHLKINIDEHGTMLTVENGSQKYMKKNDAVAEIPKISKRMTDLLAVLNIECNVVEKVDYDDY